jgi:hypothetical protein
MASMRIELSEGWMKFVRSPATVFLTALTCLSLTFAPLALFNLGKAGLDYTNPRVIACFAVIVLVPLVYVRLATLFVKQVRAASFESTESVSRGSSGSIASIFPWLIILAGAIALYFFLRS